MELCQRRPEAASAPVGPVRKGPRHTCRVALGRVGRQGNEPLESDYAPPGLPIAHFYGFLNCLIAPLGSQMGGGKDIYRLDGIR